MNIELWCRQRRCSLAGEEGKTEDFNLILN